MRAAFCGVIGPLATAGGMQAQTYANFGGARQKDVVDKGSERNPGIRWKFGKYAAALQWIPQLTFLPEPMVGLTQSVRSPATRLGPQNAIADWMPN